MSLAPKIALGALVAALALTGYSCGTRLAEERRMQEKPSALAVRIASDLERHPEGWTYSPILPDDDNVYRLGPGGDVANPLTAVMGGGDDSVRIMLTINGANVEGFEGKLGEPRNDVDHRIIRAAVNHWRATHKQPVVAEPVFAPHPVVTPSQALASLDAR